jgi:hypothetical protein
MASQNLKMISQALDNRLPPLESGQEYAPRNTFRDEDWEGDDKGEVEAVIHRQERRAAPYTQTVQKYIATARRTPPTDITDFDTDEQDVAESSYVNLDFL